MATVSSNYSEVLVTGSNTQSRASQGREKIVYADVRQSESNVGAQTSAVFSTETQGLKQTPETKLTGFGYQSFGYQSAQESVPPDLVKKEAKKESKFGQFRRSLRGKKKRTEINSSSTIADATLEGWLYKQDSAGLHLWKRRWFILNGRQLFYYKSSKSNKALGCIHLNAQQRIAPTDDNLGSKKYSFKIEQAQMRTYFIAADSKEELTTWMNGISLAALDIKAEKETIGTAYISSKKVISNVTSGVRGGEISQTSRNIEITQVPQVSATSLHSIQNYSDVNSNQQTSAFTKSIASASSAASIENARTDQTEVKVVAKPSLEMEVSSSEESEEESSEAEDLEESDQEESSMISSEMEQIHRKNEQIQQSVNNGNWFDNIQVNEVYNKTENITRNENVTVNKNIVNSETNGIQGFFSTGQHLTGQQRGLPPKAVSADLLSSSSGVVKPLAVKPPTYKMATLNKQQQTPGSNYNTATISGRAGQVYGNLEDWQSRKMNSYSSLQHPHSTASNLKSSAFVETNRLQRMQSAGDPYATEKVGKERYNRARSVGRELEEDEEQVGTFKRTQSMRSLRAWFDQQKSSGRSRAATPDPDYGPEPYHHPQPVIMDLDKNEKLIINPSTATLVRSKSRQSHKSLGTLQNHPPRPSTAMGNYAMNSHSRDQVMLHKNYQLQQYEQQQRQQFLKQQHFAQQQQQQQFVLQQQQQTLILQQQQIQQQQQLQREQEILKQKKERDLKAKQHKKLQQENLQRKQMEEQVNVQMRSRTIINETIANEDDGSKVKRVFVRRAKKTLKPEVIAPPPVTEKKEFSMQTISDIGIQTEKNYHQEKAFSPESSFIETVIIQEQEPEYEQSEESNESDEEWEVLVSSDQSSWNLVAKETLPSSVIRYASLSNLEDLVKEQLSEETRKVLEDAEEVRFSEEVVSTVLTKTIEDTTTTSTKKVISMVTEGDWDGVHIEDVPNTSDLQISSATQAVVASNHLFTHDPEEVSRTKIVTKIAAEPQNESHVTNEETHDGKSSLMTTRYKQSSATKVDDTVSYDYGSGSDVMKDFQRHVRLLQDEFGDAGDVSSDTGMSYKTPAGGDVNVQQRIQTMKTGVSVDIQGNVPTQTPAQIAITDMETHELLQPKFTKAFSTEPMQYTDNVSTVVIQEKESSPALSLHDLQLATIKRRMSSHQSKESSPVSDNGFNGLKGILKSRSSISPEKDSPFDQALGSSCLTVEQRNSEITETAHRRSDGQWVEEQVSGSKPTKTSSIFIPAKSPSVERKLLSETTAVDIPVDSPATTHYSTHVHKKIRSTVVPQITLELDTNDVKESSPSVLSTTLLVTDLESEKANFGEVSNFSLNHSSSSSSTSNSTSVGSIVEKRELLSRESSPQKDFESGLPPIDDQIEQLKTKITKSISLKTQPQPTDIAGDIGRKLIALKREKEAKETTKTYFQKRLTEEEEVLRFVKRKDGGVHAETQIKAQVMNINILSDKVISIQQSIDENKGTIEALESEWHRVKPSRFESHDDATQRKLAASTVTLTNRDTTESVNTTESKALAVEREAMRSVLSTITSQFSARDEDFDRLHREEEEIKALLASRIRGIDLEIGELEVEEEEEEEEVETETDQYQSEN